MPGPCLFLTYVNDPSDRAGLLLEHGYLPMTQAQQRGGIPARPQKLGHLEKWENEWEMSFHLDKYITPPVSTPQSTSLYLSVIIQKDAGCDKHIDNVCSNASRTQGFWRRNLKIDATRIKAFAYLTLVKGHPRIRQFCVIHTRKRASTRLKRHNEEQRDSL